MPANITQVVKFNDYLLEATELNVICLCQPFPFGAFSIDFKNHFPGIAVALNML